MTSSIRSNNVGSSH